MKKFLTYTLLGVLLAGCAGGGREPLETVVDKALAGAERQTLLMAEKYSAREGRLPRTGGAAAFSRACCGTSTRTAATPGC